MIFTMCDECLSFIPPDMIEDIQDRGCYPCGSMNIGLFIQEANGQRRRLGRLTK